MNVHTPIDDDIFLTSLLVDCGLLGDRIALITYRREDYTDSPSVTVLRCVLVDDTGSPIRVNWTKASLQSLAFCVEDDLASYRHDFPPEEVAL